MAEIKFEDALKKLEDIVAALEHGDLPLEKSLKMFEEGVRYSRICGRMLDKAEKKVEILMRNEKGELEAGPFDDGGEAVK